MSIQAIDRGSVSKICSGQVVVDLATSVKELIENSLDAGATSIEVKLKDMGVESIEVNDNGFGIDESNFAGIAMKHHTSKLKEFNDLYNVRSFGFRGEALNALCELSGNFTVSTKQDAEQLGHMLSFHRNGSLADSKVIARSNGTTVHVEKLFDKLPVRRNDFIKSIKKHYQKLIRVAQSYAVISAGVRILVTNAQTDTSKKKNTNNNVNKVTTSTILSTQSRNRLEDNISSIFGSKFLQSLIAFESVMEIDTLVENFDSGNGTEGNEGNNGNDFANIDIVDSQSSSQELAELSAGKDTKTNTSGLFEMFSAHTDKNDTTIATSSAQSTSVNDKDSKSAYSKEYENMEAWEKNFHGLQKPSEVFGIDGEDGQDGGDDDDGGGGGKERRNAVEGDTKAPAGPPKVVTITGYVSKVGSGVGRSDNDRQFLYMNGRPVDLPKFVKVINEAWRKFEMKNKPAFILDVRIPNGYFDVNLSPDKREVVIAKEAAILNRLKMDLNDLFEPSRSTFQLSQGNTTSMAKSNNHTFVKQSQTQELLESFAFTATAASDSSNADRKSNGDDKGDNNEGNDDENQSQVALSSTQVDSSTQKSRATTSDNVAYGMEMEMEESHLSVQQHATSSGSSSSQGVSLDSHIFSQDRALQSTVMEEEEIHSSSLSPPISGELKSLEDKELSDTTNMDMTVDKQDTDNYNDGDICNSPVGSGGNELLWATQEEKDLRSDLNSQREAQSQEQGEGMRLDERKRKSPIVSSQRRSRVDRSAESAKGRDNKTIIMNSSLIQDDLVSGTSDNEDNQIRSESATVPVSSTEEKKNSLTTAIDTNSDEEEVTEVFQIKGTTTWSFDANAVLCSLQQSIASQESDNATKDDDSSAGNTRKRQKNDENSDQEAAIRRAKEACALPSGDGSVSTGAEIDRALARVLTKKDFAQMRVIGQFNLGFIIAELRGDLYILDQHACDEKYLFETLQLDTNIHQQPLIMPLDIGCSAAEEMTIMDNLDIFERNGFKFAPVDHSGATPVGSRLKLIAVPFSKSVQFDVNDVHELASIVNEEYYGFDGSYTSTSSATSSNMKNKVALKNDALVLPYSQAQTSSPSFSDENQVNGDNDSAAVHSSHHNDEDNVHGSTNSNSNSNSKKRVRPQGVPVLPKLMSMFASRACRSAVMIGTALHRKEMENIVTKLQTIEHPWNCPHGRPTMRHLVDLVALDAA